MYATLRSWKHLDIFFIRLARDESFLRIRFFIKFLSIQLSDSSHQLNLLLKTRILQTTSMT